MRTKGFTLIELMIVIVILGILAAIAIPKLFGMSAKAKASEVGPAAGTWSKLIQTYVLETGSAGTWASIGYIAPGQSASTTDFNYSEAAGAAGIENGAIWMAVSKGPLNSCMAGTWSARYERMVDGNFPEHPTAQVLGAGCLELTPNFKNLR